MSAGPRRRGWPGWLRAHGMRVSVRALLRSPGYTTACILLIAGGIGATAATFGTIRAAVLRPPPLPRPQELVAIQNVDIDYNLGLNVRQVYANVKEVARLNVFASVAAQAVGAMNLGGGGFAQRVPVAYVSGDYFRTMGVAPLAGRTFMPGEATAGGDWHVAVLSHRLWMQRFAGALSVVGNTIMLNGHTYRVIGIMPTEFVFPSAPALWLPLPLPISNTSVFEAFGNFIPTETIARLRPGVSLAAANLAVARLEQQYATWSYMADSAGALVRPLQGSLMTASSRHALLTIGLAALLVLVLSTLNFAGLLTARTVRRLPDLRVRRMLGASRGDVTRAVAVEALLLAVAGAAGGIVVAWGSMPMLGRLLPPRVLAVDRPSVDPTIMLVAIGASLLVAAAVTLVFAGVAGGRIMDIRGATRHRTRLGLGWRAGEWFGGLQIALAVLLVTGAVALARRVYQLATVDTGMNLDGVMAGSVTLTRASYESNTAIATFVTQTITSLLRAPGVQGAAAVNILPIAGRGGFGETIVRADAPADSARPLRYAVTPGYFRTMGIPLLAGRDFRWSEPQPTGVILNQLAARTLWHGASAVGHQVLIGKVPHTILGVVGDVRTRQLATAPRAQMYVPFGASYTTSVNLVARGSLSKSVTAARIRDAVRQVDAQQPVSNIQDMETLVLRTVAGQRSAGILLAGFGLIALCIASVGVYALTTYRVVAQRREIAVRVALGATPSGAVLRVLRRVAIWSSAGLAAGVLATLGMARILSGLLPDAPTAGPGSLMVALGVLFSAVAIAAVIPASRGARADPMEAFRSE